MAGKNSGKITFRTGITPKVVGLSMLPTVPALLLFLFALDAFRKFHSTDPFRYVFTGAPLLIALILLGAVGVTLYQFLNREITLDGDRLAYSDYKTEMTLLIRKMAFSPPGDSGPLKFLTFSDGETFVHIPKIFMADADFDRLVSEIKNRRRTGRIESGSSTYSL